MLELGEVCEAIFLAARADRYHDPNGGKKRQNYEHIFHTEMDGNGSALSMIREIKIKKPQ